MSLWVGWHGMRTGLLAGRSRLTGSLALLALLAGCLGAPPQPASATPAAAEPPATRRLPAPTVAETSPATVTPVAYLPLVTDTALPGSRWQPRPGTSWQIQYTGDLNLTLDVQAYDLDLFDMSQSAIEQLHAQGRRVICYFSGGSWEDWRPDAGQFPPAVLGADLDDWPGEKWLDIRQLAALGPIMAARLDLAVQKRCDAVDPDNMDGYANESGFPLSAADQLAYNTWMAEQAHQRGLAVGLKNDLDQIPQLVAVFDFAVNEQCFQYNECALLLPFIQAGKPVFSIEYQGNPNQVCPQLNALDFDALFKRLELDAWRVACR